MGRDNHRALVSVTIRRDTTRETGDGTDGGRDGRGTGQTEDRTGGTGDRTDRGQGTRQTGDRTDRGQDRQGTRQCVCDRRQVAHLPGYRAGGGPGRRTGGTFPFWVTADLEEGSRGHHHDTLLYFSCSLSLKGKKKPPYKTKRRLNLDYINQQKGF